MKVFVLTTEHLKDLSLDNASKCGQLLFSAIRKHMDDPHQITIIDEDRLMYGHLGRGRCELCFQCAAGWLGCPVRDAIESLLKNPQLQIEILEII